MIILNNFNYLKWTEIIQKEIDDVNKEIDVFQKQIDALEIKKIIELQYKKDTLSAW